MSDRIDSQSENSIANIARSSGLMDIIKQKRNQSVVHSNNGSQLERINETQESVFKVPQVPGSLPSKTKKLFEWNCGRNCDDSALICEAEVLRRNLNFSSHLYRNNKNALLNLYQGLNEWINEFNDSEAEKKDTLLNQLRDVNQSQLEKVVNCSSYSICSGVNMNTSVMSISCNQCQDYTQMNHGYGRRAANNNLPAGLLNNRPCTEGNFTRNPDLVEPARQFASASSAASEAGHVSAKKRARNHVIELPRLFDSYVQSSCHRNNDSRQISSTTHQEHEKENLRTSSPILGLRENPFRQGIFSDDECGSGNQNERSKRKRLSVNSMNSTFNDTVTKRRNGRGNDSRSKKTTVKKKSRPSLNVSVVKSGHLGKCQVAREIRNWTIKKIYGSNHIELFGSLVSPNGVGSFRSFGTVLSRKDKNNVSTTHGLFVLGGPMKPTADMHPVIKENFMNGFPACWRKISSCPDSY